MRALIIALATFVIGLASLGALATAGPVNGGDSQTVVAKGGWVAAGATGAINDPGGGTFSFDATLVVPQAIVQATGSPGPTGPDARLPVVSLTESRKAPSGWQDTACTVTENLSPEIATSVRVGGVPDFEVDLECADGRGYDFYRLRWQGTEPVGWGEENTKVPLSGRVGWGPSHPFARPSYGGSAEWWSFRTDTYSAARFRICGYRSGQADCLDPQGHGSLGDSWNAGHFSGGWASVTVRITRAEETTCC